MKNALILLLAPVLVLGCSLPWNEGQDERELNVAISLVKNQIQLPTVRIAGRAGSFLLASAHRVTAVDPHFASRVRIKSREVILTLGERRRIKVKPAAVLLGSLADATVGADAFHGSAITIDYARQLLIIREAPDLAAMPIYAYAGAPSVPVIVNGKPERAVVDTLLPDTMIVPTRLAGRDRSRLRASLTVGGVAFPSVDVGVGAVEEIRVGNRVLSNFLVTIDYSRNVVALWRDPRAGAPRVDAAH